MTFLANSYQASRFIFKLKISAMIGCLRARVREQPIIALYVESETGLKFYNPEAMLNSTQHEMYPAEKF